MNVTECLKYTEGILYQLPLLSSERKKYFVNMIQKINQRCRNPYLHVALIGDFSTGKSTFINALLKQELLKTAWQATTSVPTFIYHNEKEEQQILVESPDGTKYRLYIPEEQRRLEEKLQIRFPKDDRNILMDLSTSNHYTDVIKSIRIRVPSFEGLKNICIIDTPGVNPGAKEAKDHVKKTQDILRESADATIVLFQETQIYSGSFKRFLQDNAAHFMDDAVFIITMMDLAEEEDREGLLEYARQQLRMTFGMASPKVFGCCAKAVFSEKKDQKSQYWRDSFDWLRENLFRYMAYRRNQIIRKELVGLLEDLLEELNEEVDNSLADIARRKQKLESEYGIQHGAKRMEYLFAEEKMQRREKVFKEMRQRMLGYLNELGEQKKE